MENTHVFLAVQEENEQKRLRIFAFSPVLRRAIRKPIDFQGECRFRVHFLGGFFPLVKVFRLTENNLCVTTTQLVDDVFGLRIHSFEGFAIRTKTFSGH